MNISMPDSMRAELEEVVVAEGFGNTSEFIRALVRAYLKEREERKLENVLLQRLADDDVRVRDIQEVKAALQKRLLKIENSAK
jgi:Arc/MetJ-type ribon-helix-helix transcriptional regulator